MRAVTAILLTLSVVSCLPFEITSDQNLSWVTFCRGQHKKVIHTKKCTKGVQFPRALDLPCVCAQGTWALFSENNCQGRGDDFTILYGKGDCFQLKKKVIRFVNIDAINTGSSFLIGGTSTSKRFLETTQTSSVFEFLAAVGKSQVTPKASNFFQHLVCQKKLANLQKFDAQELLVLVYQFPDATVVTSQFNSIVCTAEFQALAQVKVSLGKVYFAKNHTTLTLPHCRLNCIGHANHSNFQKHTISKRAIEKGAAHAPPHQPYTQEKNGLMNSKQNDATAALLRHNNGFLLFGIQKHLNVSTHWILLQKANKILKTACPNLDRSLQDSMVRMFRYLYARFSDGRYAPREYVDSSSRLTKVTELLEKCFTDTKPITFKFGPPGTCSKDQRIVEATIVDRKITFVGENLTLPEKELFSKTNHDVHIESIWKMVSFLHYYCSEYFFAHPFDHAAWAQMVLGFFGDDVIYRWYHPQVANKGFYASFNAKNMLDKYIQELDICVAIAKKIAVYPLWIERPSIVSTDSSMKSKNRVKRSILKEESNKCLTTFGGSEMKLCSATKT